MKTYNIRKVHDLKYGYMVFSASYQSPIDQLSDIEKDLAQKKYCGFVVFDLLLSSGNCDSRFQALYFDGKFLSLQSARVIENYKDRLKRISSKFYCKNFEKLDTTILPKPLRFKLRKGIEI